MPRTLRNTKIILLRELTGYFGSPVAYVFIVIFLMLIGFFTFSVSHFYEAGQADLRSHFEWYPWLFLFLIPSVAMRLWADEKRVGTIELIMTLPISLTEVILGKFLAAWIFVGIAQILTFPLVLSTMYLGDPDYGTIFCAYVGSFLMGGAYLSVGSMTSAITRSQVVSFILAVVACLFMVLSGWPPVTEALIGWAPNWLINLVASFSFMTHYQSIQRGVLDFRDIFYYLSFMFFMLYTNGIILMSRKS